MSPRFLRNKLSCGLLGPTQPAHMLLILGMATPDGDCDLIWHLSFVLKRSEQTRFFHFLSFWDSVRVMTKVSGKATGPRTPPSCQACRNLPNRWATANCDRERRSRGDDSVYFDSESVRAPTTLNSFWAASHTKPATSWPWLNSPKERVVSFSFPSWRRPKPCIVS